MNVFPNMSVHLMATGAYVLNIGWSQTGKN